jgi:PAS domain S-box-containing protein
MPALVVLERLPTPALAVDRAGTILFANGAFCDMLGYLSNELLSMKFKDIFCGLPTIDGDAALVRTDADGLVELAHKCGHSVWACMSKSALRRHEDAVALATFDDRTEEWWLNDVTPESARENGTR